MTEDRCPVCRYDSPGVHRCESGWADIKGRPATPAQSRSDYERGYQAGYHAARRRAGPEAGLREALQRIVDLDYRGHPAQEQVIARAALAASPTEPAICGAPVRRGHCFRPLHHDGPHRTPMGATTNDY